MPPPLGLGAALLSPLMMVIGFIIWDKHWTGSAFALNIFKCSLASILLLIMVLSTGTVGFSAMFMSFNGTILMLSAMLGIVVGDNTWLRALKLLGARRVIVVDALKPWLAAVLGHYLLDEVCIV
jgi:drug/metabolite transporter (DMT)-like permease